MTEPVDKGVSKVLIGVRVLPRIKRELDRLRKLRGVGNGKRLSPFCEGILTDYVNSKTSGKGEL